MKRIFFVLLLALCVVPFASAEYTANNGSLATTGAIWVAGGTYPAQTAEVICGVYGLTPTYASGYWHDTVFLEYSTVPLSQYNNSVPAWNVDNVTQVDKIVPGVVGLAYITIGQRAICGSNDPYIAVKHLYYNSSIYAPPPTANFTGAPLEATAPAYVAFTDTSENETGDCTYNWSFDPTDGVLAAPQDLDNEDITILFTQNGNFTITHGVSCPSGSDTEEKVDYVYIHNATDLSTFRVRAVDAISGYGVNGAQVDVFDVENASWTNQTSVTGEVTVTALTGHTINAYGSATGYDDGESLGLPVVHGSLYPIYMWPTTFGTNVSEGNVTVYVTVLEDGTNTRLPGYAVSLTGPSAGGADFTMGTTNENGIFQAVVKNQTNYNVKVLAQKGHLGANKNFNSGTQSGGDAYVEVTLWLGINSITTAPTATTLPGGGTPTPQVTYLPHCDPSAADYDEALCRASKGGVGLNLLADYMDDLILLCIFVTIMYLLGFKLGS